MKRLLLPLVAVVLAGCAGDPIPEVTPSMARKTDVDPAKLAHGRELYIANCNRCHERVLPGSMDPEYWRGIIPHMARNAKLTSTEQADVLNYLIAAHLEVYHIEED